MKVKEQIISALAFIAMWVILLIIYSVLVYVSCQTTGLQSVVIGGNTVMCR